MEAYDPQRWREIVEEMVAIARDQPKELQPVILEQLLSSALPSSGTRRAAARQPEEVAAHGTGQASEEAESVAPATETTGESGLAAVAADADVSLDALERVVGIDEDTFRIFGALEATKAKQRMIDLSVLYCYLNEHARDEKTTSMKAARELCKRDGCYDGNFSTYIAGTEYLLVEGKPGSSAKNLRLSSPGSERARELIRHMTGDS